MGVVQALETINRQARLYFVRDACIDAIDGIVIRAEGDQVTIGVAGLEGFEAGSSCVLVIRDEDETYRCRAQLADVSQLAVQVRLLESMIRADRRQYPRAYVWVRVLARHLGQHESSKPSRRPLSLVPSDGDWHTAEASLSPTGIRLDLPGEWCLGDGVEIRIHVPGTGGGEHLVLRGQVARYQDEDGEPEDIAIRFLDVDSNTQHRLMDIVDRARLAELVDDEAL